MNDIPSMPDLPSILKAEMDRLGLNHQQLADLSGISQPTVTRIVNGRHDPSYGAIRAILRGLGRSWGWLDRQGLDPRDGATRKARAGPRLPRHVKIESKNGVDG